MLANLLLLALCALGFASAAGVRTCTTVNVPSCQVRVDRDLLFLVDASESLDPDRFQGEMLNYVQSLYCAFNQQDNNRAGLITFAAEILTRIPLDSYTVTQWFQKVDEVRAQHVCCSCCTPTATAFQVAREVFTAVPIGNAFRIVFVITDGAPWQNENGPFAWPSIPSATYTWGTVPTQARLIKEMAGGDTSRYRVMMVGVPNKFGEPPREDYFKGIPDPSKRPSGKAASWQCQTRGGKQTCYQMNSPPFPIISTPVTKNLFSSQTFEVQDLINLTVESLCEILPTDSPTRQPITLTPTTVTKTPTLQPTKEPTKAPTNAPTESPVKPELDGLDMYLLLDRSRSMRWVPTLCRNAPGGNPTDGDAVACWKLFLTFVRQIVTKTVNIPYRSTTLGWKGDSPDPKRGVRVWLYAFACANEQTTPIVVHLGERIETLDQFNAAMDLAAQEVPFGGTCPGAAIERAVAMVQGNELMTRLYKTAILISDGVFYDGQRPVQGAKGFAHFGVLTYSMGIAIPAEGEKWGLTPEEIKRQKMQLTSFVQGNEARLFNFGLEGLNLLDAIAQELADQLPHDAIANLPNVAKQPYWCGWTSIARCTDTSDKNTPTGLYCKWDYERMKCFNKDACKHLTRPQCSKDKYCKWQKGQKCIAKPNVMG